MVASLMELLVGAAHGPHADVVVTAVALLVAGLLVPGITIAWGDEAEVIVVTLVALALVFGIVNASVGRLARSLSIPLNLLTLGSFAVVVDAALLLLVAWPGRASGDRLIVIGGFPPDLTLAGRRSPLALEPSSSAPSRRC